MSSACENSPAGDAIDLNLVDETEQLLPLGDGLGDGVAIRPSAALARRDFKPSMRVFVIYGFSNIYKK